VDSFASDRDFAKGSFRDTLFVLMAESDERREPTFAFEAQSDLIMQLAFLRGFLLKDPALRDAVQEFLYSLVEYFAESVDDTPDSEIISRDG
jgi:hypothetical protein